MQAIGWYLEEANMAQVSLNLTDHELTPIHTVYEEVCKDAKVSHSVCEEYHNAIFWYILSQI